MTTEKTKALTARDRMPRVGDVLKSHKGAEGVVGQVVESLPFCVKMNDRCDPSRFLAGIWDREQGRNWRYLSRADGGPITTTDDESG